MNKRISDSTSFSKISKQTGGVSSVAPFGVTGILKRFWEFAKKNAKKFSKELKNPEEKEAEFLKVIQKDFESDRFI